MAESLDELFAEVIIANSEIRNETALIHEYLEGNINAQTTAQRLIHSLQSRNAPLQNGHYECFEVVDSVIVGVAEQLPATHAALVTLLGTLRPRTDLDDLKSEMVFALNERWLRYGDPDPSLNIRDEMRNDLINLNHFAALVYEADLQDLSSFAVQTLCMAFRRGEWRANWDGQNTSDSIIALEGHVPAAVQWIMVCGQRLHDECNEAQSKWPEWEANLEWIVEQADLKDSIKLLCQQALIEMRRI